MDSMTQAEFNNKCESLSTRWQKKFCPLTKTSCKTTACAAWYDGLYKSSVSYYLPGCQSPIITGMVEVEGCGGIC